jgi:hypothetical protein
MDVSNKICHMSFFSCRRYAPKAFPFFPCSSSMNRHSVSLYCPDISSICNPESSQFSQPDSAKSDILIVVDKNIPTPATLLLPSTRVSRSTRQTKQTSLLISCNWCKSRRTQKLVKKKRQRATVRFLRLRRYTVICSPKVCYF